MNEDGALAFESINLTYEVADRQGTKMEAHCLLHLNLDPSLSSPMLFKLDLHPLPVLQAGARGDARRADESARVFGRCTI